MVLLHTRVLTRLRRRSKLKTGLLCIVVVFGISLCVTTYNAETTIPMKMREAYSIGNIVGMYKISDINKHENNTGDKSAADNNNDEDENVFTQMKRRRNLVMQACQERKMKSTNGFLGQSVMSRKRNLLYCPVAKTASTFWRRFMYQLEYTDPFRSPFDVDMTKAYHGSRGPRMRINTLERRDLQRILDTSTKLLFVRDPFSRLFSAFVDKLLAPNPVHWKAWGQPAIMKYRKNGDTGNFLNRPCGHDVTFSEFVSYALSDLTGDIHITPIYELCSPCDVNYTIIGKMETFHRDVMHLISFINVTEQQVGLDRMSDDVKKDAIADTVKDSFSKSWLKQTLKCTSKEDVAKRIWRKLQIRGFLSWRRKYDIPENVILQMTGPDYTKHIEEIERSSPKNKSELKLQKQQAKLEAYSTLQNSHYSKIIELYNPDFEMFDYEKSPKYLSPDNLKSVTNTGAFDLTTDWDLGGVL